MNNSPPNHRAIVAILLTGLCATVGMVTVGVLDVTFKMSDDALQAAREKLINIGLSRVK